MDSTKYNEIIERLRTKFKDFDVNFEQFNELLIKNNAFISGSFLLQVIQDEFYPSTTYDIDIFTFGEKNIKFENEINKIIKKSILKKILKKNLNIINKKKAGGTFYLERDDFERDDLDESMFDLDEYLNDTEYEEAKLIKNLKPDIKIDELEQSMLDLEKKITSEYEKPKKDLLYNIKIVDKNADLDKIDFERPINLNTKLIKGYNPDNKTDFVNINIHCGSYEPKIISKYKSINKCKKTNIGITNLDYDHDKINEIVDFQVSNDIMSKYQLIYYDDNVIKTPEDILKGFDFDFCANYWDGKNLFIKDLNSINSKSCIVNLKKPRIYNNQNKRIIKYTKRNFDIKLKYNDDVYQVIYLYLDHDTGKLILSKNVDENMDKIALLLDNARFSIKNILDNLPFGLEKLIIYTHNNKEIIDNLPIILKELRLYLWNYGFGTEEGPSIMEINKLKSGEIKRIQKQDRIKVDNAIKNLKKIPFGCNVYVNDELINL